MSALSFAEGKPDDSGWGEKLAEGIYILNRKKKSVDSSKLLLGSGDIRLYPDEIKRLQNCIKQLMHSNEELQEALAEDPEEVEYSLAVKENLVIMEDMKGQIKAMEDELTEKGFASLVEQDKCTQHILEDAEGDEAVGNGNGAPESSDDTLVL